MQIGFSKFLENHALEHGNEELRSSVDQVLQKFQSINQALPSHYLPGARTEALSELDLILTENADHLQLEDTIKDSCLGLIEIANKPKEVIDRIEIATTLNIIGYSLSSKSMSELNIVPVLCKTARVVFGMSKRAAATMELAIQEAAINALAHGNLGLRSAFDETGDNLNNYYSLVRYQARHGDAKNKRIDLWLWENKNGIFAVIVDQGAGYRPPERRIPSSSDTPTTDRRKTSDRRQSGRGLDIMRQFAQDCWVSPTGTSVAMRFGK